MTKPSDDTIQGWDGNRAQDEWSRAWGVRDWSACERIARITAANVIARGAHPNSIRANYWYDRAEQSATAAHKALARAKRENT